MNFPIFVHQSGGVSPVFLKAQKEEADEDRFASDKTHEGYQNNHLSWFTSA